MFHTLFQPRFWGYLRGLFEQEDWKRCDIRITSDNVLCGQNNMLIPSSNQYYHRRHSILERPVGLEVPK